mgnify:CR=1 FL=1
MTKDLRPENQAEAEALAREFKDRICQSEEPTFNRMLNPDFLELDFENRTLTLAYDFTYWIRNQVGIMHGGIIGAAADIAMGVLTYTFSGKKMPPKWLYSPSVFSRTTTKSTVWGVAADTGLLTPLNMRIGRRLTYSLKPWRMASRGPSEM